MKGLLAQRLTDSKWLCGEPSHDLDALVLTVPALCKTQELLQVALGTMHAIQLSKYV